MIDFFLLIFFSSLSMSIIRLRYDLSGVSTVTNDDESDETIDGTRLKDNIIF